MPGKSLSSQMCPLANTFNESGIHAVVPVNLLKHSKARLASALRSGEREKLTVAMLKDVLRALGRAPRVKDVTVVSPDLRIRSVAHRYGARFFRERHRRGLNRALTLATRSVVKKQDDGVLIVHADLPLIKTSEVDRLIANSRNREVTIAPCKKNMGTNALFLRHAGAIPLSFGRNSFKKHLASVRRRKLRYKVLRLTGFQFDVDDPRDLQWLMHGRARGETEGVLAAFRQRVESHSAAIIASREV